MFPEDDDTSNSSLYGLEDLGLIPEWMMQRKRRKAITFSPANQVIDQMIEEMILLMECMNNPSDVPQGIPLKLVRRRKLPDGTDVLELGPVVFGYSMTVDENGNSVVRQFGNINPSQPVPLETLQEKSEPLIDIINDGDTVKIVAELAGVKKEEISVVAEADGKIVIETTGTRKYYKALKVGAAIYVDSGTSTYNNGILTLTFKTANPLKPNGKVIKVE